MVSPFRYPHRFTFFIKQYKQKTFCTIQNYMVIDIIIITESALKSGIFEIQSGLCGYSGRYTANGSRCEKLCKNHHKPAKSLSERPEKVKYRSLKC